MASIERLIGTVNDFTEEKKQEDEQTLSIEELIIQIDSKLDEYKDVRSTINQLKEQKDKYIFEYIKNTKQPNQLDTKLINYKALYFYFKAHFIEQKNRFLIFSSYNNDITKIQPSKSEIFEKCFDEEGRIYLDIKETNFPHLIGYKVDERDTYGQYDNTKNRTFLNSIYYETNLLEDYEEHGCHLGKIKTISWILSTLEKPRYVFLEDGLEKTKTNLKTDLIFVRSSKSTYHYVSLIKITSCTKTKYVINSHHRMSRDEFRTKFNTNKAIYLYKWDK